MRVKMKTIMSGPNGSAQPGQVINVDDDEGAALIKGGYAEEAQAEKKAEVVETADTEGAEENTATRTSKKGK